ncbi:unnamed protein product [Cuscuta campestris]|uniref:Uncharacterized protein n=1 Tax=Cuscuta campestris TaxID=132261 RepID=A0A484LWN9_9ASTE|nr:unnamed protein product [Cuscuta campestris]
MPNSDGKFYPSLFKPWSNIFTRQNALTQRREPLPIDGNPAMGGHTHGWEACFPWLYEGKEKRTRFLTFFSKRVLAPQRIVPERFPELQGYDDLDAQLHQASLWPFVSRAQKEINSALIRVFYSNLRREGDVLYSLVKSTPIELSVEQFGRIAGLPYQGDDVSQYGGEDWVLNKEGLILTELIRHASGRPTIHSANPESWLLLYIVSRIIKPRKHGHTIMSGEDLKLIHAIMYSAPINWAKFVMINMTIAASTDHDHLLPYPFVVMDILERFKVTTTVGLLTKATKIWAISTQTFKKRSDNAGPATTSAAPRRRSATGPAEPQARANLASSHQVTNFHFHSSSISSLPDEVPETWTKKVQGLIESALASQHASFRQDIEQMEARYNKLIEKSEETHCSNLKEISKSVDKTLEIISLLSNTVSNTMETYASDIYLQLKEVNKIREQIANVTVSLQKQMSLLQMDIRAPLAVSSANQVVTKDYLKVIIDNQKEAHKLFRLLTTNSGNRKMEVVLQQHSPSLIPELPIAVKEREVSYIPTHLNLTDLILDAQRSNPENSTQHLSNSGLDGTEAVGTIAAHFSNENQTEERRNNIRRIKELCGNMQGIREIAGSSKRKKH